jgi:hypothetical protein
MNAVPSICGSNLILSGACLPLDGWRDSNDGIMIPTPQYPLYSATVTAIDATAIGYSLIEKTGWKLDPDEIGVLCAEARKNGITPRCLVSVLAAALWAHGMRATLSAVALPRALSCRHRAYADPLRGARRCNRW